MARIAVISDIHGNLIALDRVIADVRSRRVDRMVCLGDIVGYGPDPKECLDIVRQYCDGIVAGNHERGVTEPDLAVNWSPLAKAGIEHARAQLTSADMAELERLPMSFTMGSEVLGVHDSPEPSEHGMNYLRNANDAADAFFWLRESICLVGHTHVAACFVTECAPTTRPHIEDLQLIVPGASNEAVSQEWSETCLVESISLPRQGRAIVNPGSVGQPRDRDPRASYAIIDLEKSVVDFHRVCYDIE